MNDLLVIAKVDYVVLLFNRDIFYGIMWFMGQKFKLFFLGVLGESGPFYNYVCFRNYLNITLDIPNESNFKDLIQFFLLILKTITVRS